MNSNVKISVIIPIYSVEKYLRECIDSVLAQTYKNFEIILVNDGSPDGCGEICNEYADTFPNVKVIHKENGGLSDARNRGINIAEGDYILFLDGDDFWDDENALEKLASRAEKTDADVINFSFCKYNDSTKEKTPYFDSVPPMPLNLRGKKEQLEYLSSNSLYISSACTKLIKCKLFTNHLLFEKGVYSEDVVWSAHLLCAADSMDFICEKFYCYRQHGNSISHTVNDKKCANLCKHIITCIDLCDTATDNEKSALCKYAAYQFGTYFIVQAQAEKTQAECINKLARYSHILSHHKNNKKLTVLYWGTKIMGYKNLCRLVRFIYRKTR